MTKPPIRLIPEGHTLIVTLCDVLDWPALAHVIEPGTSGLAICYAVAQDSAHGVTIADVGFHHDTDEPAFGNWQDLPAWASPEEIKSIEACLHL